MESLEHTFVVDGEKIEIWRFGQNDYCVNFYASDCSTRGTLVEVLQDIDSTYGISSLLKSK